MKKLNRVEMLKVKGGDLALRNPWGSDHPDPIQNP